MRRVRRIEGAAEQADAHARRVRRRARGDGIRSVTVIVAPRKPDSQSYRPTSPAPMLPRSGMTTR